jgi:murein DD-endopeptidase MepM/ murein hydrolase activator NlpD
MKGPVVILGAAGAVTALSVLMYKKAQAESAGLVGFQTGYFHLEKPGVVEGQRVKRGEFLGLMGADPNGGPRHLHFELMPFPFPGGKYARHNTLDPEDWLEAGILGWPVEVWQGRKSVISSSHFRRNPSRDHEGEDDDHAGVDIMLKRLSSDTQPVAKGEGAVNYVAYRGMRILAAERGIVHMADWTSTGNRIWIRHD